jgi:Dolichyl-phosphate-mannose-protein mannosyltransferase
MILILQSKSRSAYLSIGLLMIFNLGLQLILFKQGFDNQVFNQHSITSTDSLNYTGIAQKLLTNGFTAAFREGYRLPGYPAFLAFFSKYFDQPWLAARYVQAILCSCLIPLSYLTFRSLLKSHRIALGGAILFALWVPFYHFSPILYAEALSLFFVGLLVYSLTKVDRDRLLSILTPAFIIALLTYIRPNHLLLLVPYAGFLWVHCAGIRIDRRMTKLALSILFFAMVIMPWSTWLSWQNQALMPLSTTQGSTLYLSTAEGSQASQSEIYQLEKTIGEKQANQYYEQLTQKSWATQADKNIQYGFEKVLRTFGFWNRRGIDFLMAAQFVLALGLSFLLWQRKLHLPWITFFWGCVFITALQSFIFHEGFRFKLILFDLPAMVIIYLGMVLLLRGRDRRNAHRETHMNPEV